MDAHSDAHGASVVNAAETHDCREWLKDAIRTLATAGALAKRARALTAASFSDISFDDFDSLISLAQVENTWVQSLVPRLRTNVGKNVDAKYWFELFLTDQQADTAWGALEMCLSSADLRFTIWQARLGKMPETADLAARRRKFLLARRRDIQERLDREKDRREILFGVKIARGEIFPFMGGVGRCDPGCGQSDRNEDCDRRQELRFSRTEQRSGGQGVSGMRCGAATRAALN
jgi:hypothetical protein